ncbi:Defensin-like protein 308, partial [Frankliniella fusca]
MTGNKLFEISFELLPKTSTYLHLRSDELHSTVSFPENEITFQVAVIMNSQVESIAVMKIENQCEDFIDSFVTCKK